MKRQDYGIALAMAGGVIVAAWLSGGLNAADDPLPVGAPAPVASATADCQEDEPCWDCATMGNRVCGPTSDAATALPGLDGAPDWLLDAEDDYQMGGDTHRLAELHLAVEYASQEGLTWQPVTQELGDALAEGETPPGYEGADYPWESCVVAVGDTTVVACPDGLVVTS